MIVFFSVHIWGSSRRHHTGDSVHFATENRFYEQRYARHQLKWCILLGGNNFAQVNQLSSWNHHSLLFVYMSCWAILCVLCSALGKLIDFSIVIINTDEVGSVTLISLYFVSSHAYQLKRSRFKVNTSNFK